MRLLIVAFGMFAVLSPLHAQQIPPRQQPARPSAGTTADPRINAFNKSLAELGALYRQSKYQQAIPLGEELVENARAIYGERHFRYTGSLYNLGLIYNGAKRYEDAARAYTDAFVAQHPLRSPADKAYKRILSSLAAINRQLGRPRETGRHYLAALRKLQQNGQINSAAAVYYYAKAGQLMRYLANFEDSEKLLRHALETRRKISKPGDNALVRQLNALAGLLRARGKFAEAEPLYREAIDIQIKTKGEWNASTGILLDNIAVMYLHMGQPEAAEPFQKRALAIIEKTLGQNHRSTGITLANLAELYRKLGHKDASEKLFERAIAVLSKTLPPNHPHMGVVLDNLAGLYREQHKNQKAYNTYLKAIERLKSAHGPDHPEVAIALNNIGLVLGNLGRHEEAEARFTEALELARRAHGDDSVILATSLANRADNRIALNRLDASKADAKRAIQLITNTLGPTHRKLIFPLTRLGEVDKRRGDIGAAFNHFKRAAELYELVKQRDRNSSFGDSGSIGSLLEAAFEASTPNPDNPFQKAAFRFSQLKTLTSASDALSKLGARLGADNAALRALARERQDVQNAWAKTDSQLLNAVSSPQKDRNLKQEAGLRAQILIYAKRLKALDDQLAKQFPQFTELSRPRPVTIKEIQTQLAPDEVVLQYLVTYRHTYAWAISKRSVQWHRVKLSRRKLRKSVHALRCGLDQSEWLGETKPLKCFELVGRFADGDSLPFATTVAHDLYVKLLKPFETMIAGRKLLIVGSDALTRLPMQILLTAPVPDDSMQTLRNAPWLIRRHAITDLPSVSSFIILRKERQSAQTKSTAQAKEPYFAVANPLLHGADGKDRSAYKMQSCPPAGTRPGAKLVASAISHLNSYFRGTTGDVARLRQLAPLPDTTTEVCAVARDLGAKFDHVLLGKAATERAIKSMNSHEGGLERYRVIHFATHGLVSGEVRGVAEPALVLSPPDKATPEDDGVLTASEVAELKLDAEWVILSACNTAAGAGYVGDALSGLARSFFYAGARSLLVSHWPVRSDAAVALTTRAMSLLSRNASTGRSAAMQQAMLSVISDASLPGAAHPQVWAPFVVVGEGAAVRRN